MAEQNLVYIPVAEIHPHSDNLRKDVGDVSELAASIAANGILQNLTVVKGHAMSALEKADLSHAWVDEMDSDLKAAIKDTIRSGWSADGYTVIIGHRRLAAAKLAGLTEVPCTIAEMTHKEQVSTMLTENMQRADLTVYEQAQGFQLMLNLGSSVEEIAKEAGFSPATVRRRVKLLELDQEKFKASEARGATLADYIALDKITDRERKNKVLETAGTANFNLELRKALEEEELAARLALWEAEISKWATKIEARGKVGDENVPMEWMSVWNKWTDKGCRRWIQSNNLAKPWRGRPNDSRYSPRQMEKLAKLPEDCEAVRTFWAKQYPQWHIYSIEKLFNPETARTSWYLEMRRKEMEQWKKRTKPRSSRR